MAEDDKTYSLFRRAFSYFNSTDKRSIAKLQQMLDYTVEKRYGKEKTLAYVFTRKKQLLSKEEMENVITAEDNKELKNAREQEPPMQYLTCKVCCEKKTNYTGKPLDSAFIQCHDCESTFHPYCHNPPVMSFNNVKGTIWFCSECSDIPWSSV